MKKVLAIAFLLLTSYAYSQDTIRTNSSQEIIAKILEINNDEIKYKKFSNINGPIYLLSKNEINSITYLNGEMEMFDNPKIKENRISEFEDVKLFKKITKNNNTVYIDSDDANAIIHATNAIGIWGYWIITKNIEDADFIIKFNIRFAGLGDAFGSAEFIYPKNNMIIKETKEVNTIMDWDLNTKRGVINKIVRKEIKPLFRKK